jgi:hypothetical protein
MAISSKPTSGQLHVSLAENHRSIQCPPSDNFRFARHPPKNQRGPNAPGTDTITPPAETRILDV